MEQTAPHHPHVPPHSMPFRLSQDPNSQHLGTTVWDASIVLAKYLEQARALRILHTPHTVPLQQAGKGEWGRAKLKNKRCIELGAGSGGLAGMVRVSCCALLAMQHAHIQAFAAMGCQQVVLTDVQAVLPLLRHNVNVNMSPSALKGLSLSRCFGCTCPLILCTTQLHAYSTQVDTASRSHLAGQVAQVDVCELDWLCPEQWHAMQSKAFDYVLAADCIYEEGLVAHLLTVVNAMAAPRATGIVHPYTSVCTPMRSAGCQ